MQRQSREHTVIEVYLEEEDILLLPFTSILFEDFKIQLFNRQSFQLLVQSPHANKGQCWARSKLEARNASQVSHMGDRGTTASAIFTTSLGMQGITSQYQSQDFLYGMQRLNHLINAMYQIYSHIWLVV